MDKQPTNLIQRFVRRIQQVQKLMDENVLRADLGSLNGIPAMYSFVCNLQNYEAGKEVMRRNEELMEHYDMLNANGPVAKALRVMVNEGRWVVDQSDRLLTPLPTWNQPGDQVGLEELLNADWHKLFNNRVRTPSGYRGQHLLDGLVPTILSDGKREYSQPFVDIFDVNREAFQTPRDRFDQRVGINDDYYLDLAFRLDTTTQHENRWNVEVKIFHTKNQAHWVVRTRMQVTYRDRDVGVTSFLSTEHTSGISHFLGRNKNFGGSDGPYSPYDAQPPAYYENTAPLSMAIEVYNELEDTIHFGTENLIPLDTLRAGLREFLYANKHFTVERKNLLSNEDVGKKFLKMWDDLDVKVGGKQIAFRRNRNSEFVMFTLFFQNAVGSEKLGEGVLQVDFDYYSLRNLLDLDTVPDYYQWPDNRNASTIKFTVVCEDGKEPELTMNYHQLTNRSLNLLLETAISMQEREKKALETKE